MLRCLGHLWTAAVTDHIVRCTSPTRPFPPGTRLCLASRTEHRNVYGTRTTATPPILAYTLTQKCYLAPGGRPGGCAARRHLDT
ncbi:unnamed protein product [Lota lota]